LNTLVIGLGNPNLGDDGVGWRVAEEISRRTADNPAVEVDCSSLGGLSLMERLTGSRHVVLIAANHTGLRPVGSLSRFTLSDLPDAPSAHSASADEILLRNALSVGRGMNILLPRDEDVLIVAIETANDCDFSQELSPLVAAAVPLAVNLILDIFQPQ
jgi:hydrogenase maturation protease